MPIPNQSDDSERALAIPSTSSLVAELRSLSSKIDAVGRIVEGVDTRRFVAPDGRVEDMGVVCLSIEQLALLAYFARHCRTAVSVEIGFGMGTSALLIAAIRAHFWSGSEQPEHWVFDPYGMGEMRGQIIETYLNAQYGTIYKRVLRTSQVGLGLMQEELGPGVTDFVFIDGSHRLENVLTDFVLSDELCRLGGHIMLDDYSYPGVETAVTYLQRNRRDYTVNTTAADNFAIMKKVSRMRPGWGQFTPFPVSELSDWNRRPRTIYPEG